MRIETTQQRSEGSTQSGDVGDRVAVWREWTGAVVASAVTLAVLAAVYLLPYLVHHFQYPVGWDAATSVQRIQSAASNGLDRIGAIRGGASLLLAVTGSALGQNAFVSVALAPALLPGVAALAVGALLRAAFDMRAIWIPVVGFVGWAAFGGNGMINVHLDNLLNAAMTLAAVAAAVVYVEWRRGAIAAAVLFMAAALAHWPFFVFTMAFYVPAVVAFAVLTRRADGSGDLRPLTTGLLAPALAGGVMLGATFLVPPPTGWVGVRLGALSEDLRARFLARLEEPGRYYAFPLAAGGLAAGTLGSSSVGGRRARRFLMPLLVFWILATVAGGVAQYAGVPTAGARLLHYFFAAPILTGILLWWLVTRARHARWAAVLVPLAALLAAVAVAGFATLTVRERSDDRPWFDEAVLRDVAWSGRYLETVDPTLTAVYVLGKVTDGEPAWPSIQAGLPVSQTDRALPYWGTPEGFLQGAPSRKPVLGTLPPRSRAVVIVLRRMSLAGFRQTVKGDRARQVAPGVAVAQGPVPSAPLPPPVVPTARLEAGDLAFGSAGVILVWVLAGLGWSVALLPRDAPTRVAMAPALGAALIAVTSMAPAALGSGFSPVGAWALVTGVGAAGWMAAVVRRRLAPPTTVGDRTSYERTTGGDGQAVASRRRAGEGGAGFDT
ncbi:MAG: hypothetical protein ABR518_07055 [Actinomycetota bacterium]